MNNNTMNTKHIAGPWFARHVTIQNGKGGSQRWHILAGKDRSIQVCSLLGWDEDDEANARLIAAAPELLKALQDLADCGSQDHDDNPMGRTCSIDDPQDCALCGARSAIAKATGE